VKNGRIIAIFIIFVTTFSPSEAGGATPKITFSYGDINYFNFKNSPNSLSKSCKKLSAVATYDYLNTADNCALIWSSNVPVSGRIFLQVFENGTWLRISDSARWLPGGFSDYERNGVPVKKKFNSQESGSFAIRVLDNPTKIEAMKMQNSRVATGELCWAQDAGPLRFRVHLSSTSGSSAYSNEVRVSYKNFENIKFDGFQCALSAEVTQSTPKPTNKTPGVKLPACTISQIIDLKNYILKRYDAYEIQRSSLVNIRIQQDVAVRALSAQARENANASINKWTILGQQAAGVVREFELLFGGIKNKCSADDVVLPVLAPIE
jgi:hypothetical protein